MLEASLKILVILYWRVEWLRIDLTIETTLVYLRQRVEVEGTVIATH